MKLVRQGGQVLTARIVQAATAAAAGWLVARSLGPAGQGHYSLLVLAATAGAAVLNGGLGLAAVPLLRRGKLPARRILAAQFVWSAGVLLVALPVYRFLLPVWPALGGLLSTLGIWWVVLPTVALLVALLLVDILSYDLTAVGRVLQPPLVGALRASGWLLLVVVLASTGRLTPGPVLMALAGSQLAAALGLTVLGARALETDGDTERPALREIVVSLWRAGRIGQLSAVVSLLHLRLDLALVAAFHPAAVVGVYSVSVLVGELLWLLPGALQPLLVYSAAGSDSDRDERSAAAVRLAVGATAVAAIPLFFVAPLILPRLFGNAYAGAGPALRALLPGIVVFAAGSVLAADFIGRGRSVWNTQASLSTLAVNIVAGLILIPHHGAVGAAWASSLAYAVGSAVMLIRFHHASGLGWSTILRPTPHRHRSS